jgi:hypothetical protein
MAIQNLPAVDKVSASDSLAIFSAALGADARAALSVVSSYLTTLLTVPGAYVTQYASPNATGFNVNILAAGSGLGQNVFLLLTPTAAFAAGTITLPLSTILSDGQELMVTCTQAVTALTVAGNGAVVNGAPTSLAANGFFRLRYDRVNNSWYRVG